MADRFFLTIMNRFMENLHEPTSMYFPTWYREALNCSGPPLQYKAERLSVLMEL